MQLAAQLQAREQRLIALFRLGPEIVEQLAPTSDHFQKATTTAVILRVLRKMICQIIDAIREPHDLNIGAAGVFFVQLKALGISVSDLAHWWIYQGVPANLADLLVLGLKGHEAATNHSVSKEKFDFQEAKGVTVLALLARALDFIGFVGQWLAPSTKQSPLEDVGARLGVPLSGQNQLPSLSDLSEFFDRCALLISSASVALILVWLKSLSGTPCTICHSVPFVRIG